MSRTQRWVLILTGVPSLMVTLDILCLTTALPVIREELGSSVAVLEWTVTGYNLAFAITLLPFSALGDRWGRRRSFAAGIALFTLGSLGCALASTSTMLIASRVVQGLGGAMIVPIGLALVASTFPPERRGRALGIAAASTGLATLSGPVLGAVITEFLGWHWIFWINVPLGLLTIPLVLSRVAESRASAAPIDLVGLGLSSAVVLGAVGATSPGAPRPAAIGLAGMSVAALLALVAWQRSHRDPIIPMAFLRDRSIVSGSVASLLHSAVILGAVFWMAQLFHEGLGYDTVTTGLALLVWTGTMPVVGPLAGRLVDAVGARPVLVGGLVLQGIGLGWIALAVTPTTPYLSLLVPLLLAGVGGSAVFPAAQATVLAPVPHDAVGRASGLNAMIREFGGVLGIATVSAVFAHVGGFASAQSVVDGVRVAFGVCAALAVAGALVGVLSARRDHRSLVAAPTLGS